MFGLKQKHIDAINQCFEEYESVKEVIIYGSRAKGNYRPGSDIDLTIIEHGLSLSELLKLENKLDDLMLPYKIDLSIRRQIINPSLIEHIDRVGKVFFSRDKHDPC